MKKKYLYILPLWGGIMFYLIYNALTDHKKRKLYGNLDYYDEVRGEVTGVFQHKSFSFVDVGERKYCIDPSRNVSLDIPRLWYFLKKGDFLIKKMESDSLIVLRNGTKYVFIIGDQNFEKDPVIDHKREG